jgi:hypothetical protein
VTDSKASRTDYAERMARDSKRPDLLGEWQKGHTRIRVYRADDHNVRVGRIDGIKGGPTTMLTRTLVNRWIRI